MIYTVKNDAFSSNTYIIAEQENCVIIDPGLDTDKILSAIVQYNLSLVAILATHGHFDHIGSAEPLRQKYNVPFYLHEHDVKMVKSANFFLKVAKMEQRIQTPIPTHVLKQEETSLQVKGFEFEIKNYPGHTDGSCVIRYKNNIFSGDIIYANQFIENKFPGENLNRLRESIFRIFNDYPSDIMVYPGHGTYSTLSEIRSNNKPLAKFLTGGVEQNE